VSSGGEHTHPPAAKAAVLLERFAGKNARRARRGIVLEDDHVRILACQQTVKGGAIDVTVYVARQQSKVLARGVTGKRCPPRQA
jgi:hypothetical protein